MSRVRTSYRPSPHQIDMGWPHQVALPDDLCCQPNFHTIRDWLTAHAPDARVHEVTAVWPDRKYALFRLHCFRTEEDAEAFFAQFGGERFYPTKDREGGKSKGCWRREGEYRRITESGPLRLHPVFLRSPGNMEYDQ